MNASRSVIFFGAFLSLCLLTAPVKIMAANDSTVINQEQQQIVTQFLDIAFNAYVDKDYESAATYFIKILQINPQEDAALQGIKQCKKKLKIKLKDGQASVNIVKDLMHDKNWIEAIDSVNFILIQTPSQIDAWELKQEMISKLNTLARKARGKNENLMYEGLLLYLNGRSYEALVAWSQIHHNDYDDMPIQNYVQKVGSMLGYRSYEDTIKSLQNNARVLPKVTFGELPKKAKEEDQTFSVNDPFYSSQALSDSVKISEPATKIPVAAQENIASSPSISDAASVADSELTVKQENQSAKLDTAENITTSNDNSQLILPNQSETNLSAEQYQALIGEYYDKGISYREQGRLDDSLEQWEKMLQIAPNNEVAKKYAGELKAKGAKSKTSSKTKEPALEKKTVEETKPDSLAQAIRSDNNEVKDVSVTVKTEQVLETKNLTDPQKTILLEEPPVDSSKQENLNLDQGVNYFKEKQFAKAIEFFEAILRKYPNHQETLGWLEKTKEDQKELAQKHYRKALLLYTQGDVEKAVEEWKTVLEIDPDHSRAKSALKKIQN